MNKYHSFYLEDMERLIREVALEEMMTPMFNPDKDTDVRWIAYYNEGIRSMVNYLIDAIRAEAEEGSTDE